MPTISASAAMGTAMAGRWYQTMLLYIYMHIHSANEGGRTGYRSGMAIAKTMWVALGVGSKIAIIGSGASPDLEVRKILRHIKDY
jgi:hypothetical protein